MTVEQARTWLIGSSLGITAANALFFLVAPTFGFPLDSDQGTRLLQIAVPVFTGYLGSAIHFVFSTSATMEPRHGKGVSKQFGLLVRGPVLIFIVWAGAAIVAFGVSNSSSAAPGIGMSVDTLALNLTGALALLTATTNAIVGYVFGRQSGTHSVGTSPGE